MTDPKATPHKVDIYAVLSYFAGIGGYAAVLTGLVDPHNHVVRSIVVGIASVSFFSGLALRTFFNQTAPGKPPENTQGPDPGLVPK